MRWQHAPLPWAKRHVRDLWPHSLQIEQRCGLFFRDRPTETEGDWLLEGLGGEYFGLAHLLLLSGGVNSAGMSIVETGLPITISALCRLPRPIRFPTGMSMGMETEISRSATHTMHARRVRGGSIWLIAGIFPPTLANQQCHCGACNRLSDGHDITALARPQHGPAVR